jgi:glycosyltransferase involved in cell wall biosynthesis
MNPLNTKPLVSILLPIYNAAQYLKECLDSIFNQTYQNFEIIAIDDGSTDNPEFILQGFKDSRLHYFKNESNLGVAKTLNKALKHANGEFIMRMDADDVILPNKIKEQVNFFGKFPETDILGTAFSQFSYNRPLNNNLPANDSDIKLELFFRCPLCHPTVMIKREALIKNELEYNESLQTAEDYNLWTDACIKGLKFTNLPEKMLIYRQHANQNTDRYYEQLLILDDIIRLKIAKFYFKNILTKYTEEAYLSLINHKFNDIRELKRIKKIVLELKKTSISTINQKTISQFWQQKWYIYLDDYCYNYTNIGFSNSLRVLKLYITDKTFFCFSSLRKKVRFIFVCLYLK